jgi:hypothetical protein
MAYPPVVALVITYVLLVVGTMMFLAAVLEPEQFRT